MEAAGSSRRSIHKSTNSLLFMTNNRRFLHCIIITMILTTTHDSAISWGGSLPFCDHLFRVAACLDGLENSSHVSVTETERARLAIERVAHIEQRRGDARLASRFGDEATVLQDVRDPCLDCEIATDEFRRLHTRDVT